ncbi:MAG: cysteine synthase A [Thermaerobacter sp.]
MSAGVYDHVLDLIGRTPMIRVRGFEEIPDGVEVYAKLEWYNPGGSVKDRIGAWMIRDAEERGLLRPGGTIIEPTAGNTGIGLALAAAGRYRVIFVVPEHFSMEKQALMRALGAEIVHTPRSGGMEGAIARARALAAEIPGAWVPQQFANPANPEAHYRTTGPEIWEQMQGRVDIFVAGVGSGGTFTGTARYLKEKNPRLKAVAVEPEGSILGGGPKGPHETEGIGVEFIPETLDVSLVDQVYTVMDADAFAMVRALARRCGLLAASSSGAAFWAALQEARAAPPGTRIAVIFPDAADRYLSKDIYGKFADGKEA